MHCLQKKLKQSFLRENLWEVGPSASGPFAVHLYLWNGFCHMLVWSVTLTGGIKMHPSWLDAAEWQCSFVQCCIANLPIVVYNRPSWCKRHSKLKVWPFLITLKIYFQLKKVSILFCAVMLVTVCAPHEPTRHGAKLTFGPDRFWDQNFY